MAGKSVAILKTQFLGTDPQHQNDDVLDLVDELDDALDAESNSYGELEATGASAAQTLALGVAEILDAFDADGPSSSDITPAHATNLITCAAAGVYLAMFHASFISSTDGETYLFQFAIDGTPAGPGVKKELVLGADQESIAMNRALTLTAGQTLAVWVTTTANGNITVDECALVVQRLA